MAEQAPVYEELPENLFPLSELFPDVSLKHILHILRISNDDFDAAVEQLLSYDLIKSELERLDTEEAAGRMKEGEKEGKRTQWTSVESPPRRRHSGQATRRPSESFNDAIENMKVEQWAKRFEQQDEVMELLEIDEAHRELVGWYLEQNFGKKLDTVCDIMLNFDPRLPPSDQPREKLDTASFRALCLNRVRDGKDSESDEEVSVDAGADADALAAPDSPDPFSMSRLIRRAVKGQKALLSNDDSWSELQKVIKDNPQLKLPDKFYLVAMKWFHKDLDKILHTAIQLNELFDDRPRSKRSTDPNNLNFSFLALESDDDDGGDDDDRSSAKRHDENKLSNSSSNSSKPFRVVSRPSINSHSTYPSAMENLQWRADNLKLNRNTTNSKYLKSYYNQSIAETRGKIRDMQDMSQSQEVNQKIEQAKRTFKIDFHSFTVQSAMYALNVCLNYWWDQEMHLRNITNTKLEFTDSHHVEPFVVVTGRGLHSAGGIPKIKNATVKYLKQHHFKFDENMSVITVLGKRKANK